jgi:hypothetical protein
MIPIGATRHLARKKTALQERRARLIASIQEIDSELTQIQAAELTLRNGKTAAWPDILQGLSPTQKDQVLKAVRARPKSGSTRHLIASKLAIGVNSVSTYLTKLHK